MAYFGRIAVFATLFSIALTHGGAAKVVHDFSKKLEGPDDTPTPLGENLYGTTAGSDESNNGTVYVVHPDDGVSLLHAFSGGAGGVTPDSPLVSVSGILYGTTLHGGVSGCGTVYSITPAGAFNVVYSFGCDADGDEPTGKLAVIGATLYGVTYSGGLGYGTIYALTTGGAHKVLHAFSERSTAGISDGSSPIFGLTAYKGKLYGLTVIGGTDVQNCQDYGGYGCGTFYSITPSGIETVIRAFKQTDPVVTPYSDVAEIDGIFYGETAGGKYGDGAIFSISPDGKLGLTYSFKQSNKIRHAFYGLTSVRHTLYGVSEIDGGRGCEGSGCGVVFSVTTDGGEKDLYSPQNYSGGYLMTSPPIEWRGALYGVTNYGGTLNHGTLYLVRP